jgi:hypothetical protein
MWSRAEKIAVIGVVVTILGVLATIMFPEFRRFLGLRSEPIFLYLKQTDRDGSGAQYSVGDPKQEPKLPNREVHQPPEEPKSLNYGQKHDQPPDSREKVPPRSEPIVPPDELRGKTMKTMDKMLADLSHSSEIPVDTTLAGYLRERHVQVLFTEPQLQVAAQIVHRLRALGATVEYKLVPNDKTMGNPHVLYHWNYLQAAQAIQAALQGIQPLELERDDSSRVISVWIS